MAKEPKIDISLYAQTDIGMIRHGNEDNFLVLNLATAQTWTAETNDIPEGLLSFSLKAPGSLVAVADGMGGALAGEVASQMAVSIVRDRLLQLLATPKFSQIPFHEKLRLAIEQANSRINQESLTNIEYSGMGATFTAAGIEGDIAYLAQVGDSRCYLIRQGRIAQMTKDQSLVSQLVEAGHITEEEAEQHSYKNVILQALGAQAKVNVIVDKFKLRRGDILLLCSDGLSGKVKNKEILDIVLANFPDLKACCQALIKLANERGGEDNITVVIAKISGDGLIEPDTDGPQKPEFIPRDPTLPDEIDPSQLTSLEEPTLRPERSKGNKLDVIETQEVQATMLNLPAVSPLTPTSSSQPNTNPSNEAIEAPIANSPVPRSLRTTFALVLIVVAVILVVAYFSVRYLNARQNPAFQQMPTPQKPSESAGTDTSLAAKSEYEFNLVMINESLERLAARAENMPATQKKDLETALTKIKERLNKLQLPEKTLSTKEMTTESNLLLEELAELEKKYPPESFPPQVPVTESKNN
ncbi:MAG: Stp1/IreP family PP2C-type Ser/Thr phosphatase [Acidobacteriota bacterium]|nr:Stp1/IreP family PP2C-type Ser/Thr phosphatase [Blastocatellia bacterium]MDW8413559.1 Stp1/IreP family PP2C-type Ser/Thr phosphatase [Acidobacteriota bacterium]